MKSKEVRRINKNIANLNKGKKRKEIKTYVTYKGAAKKIEEYGAEYSVKEFFKQILVILIVTFVSSYFLRLRAQAAIVIGFVGIVSILPLTLVRYKQQYEQEKYLNLVTYIEQMIMCFRVQPKILYAMTESAKNLTNSRMKKRVEKACKIIYNGQAGLEGSVYANAFKEIEKYYSCDYIRSLHRMLERIETTGGEYQGLLNTFLADVQKWSERVRIYQKDKKANKRTITISIVLSLAICIAIGLILSNVNSQNQKRAAQQMYEIAEGETAADGDADSQNRFDDVIISAQRPDFSLDMANSALYQVSTTLCITISFLLYVILNFTTAKSWFIYKTAPDEQIMSDYEKAIGFDMPKQVKKAKRNTVIIVLVGIVGLLLTRRMYVIAIAAVMGLLEWYKPKRMKKSVIARTTKELEKKFPDWLRDIALSAQTQTIQNAVAESYAHAPVVLHPAIRKMVEDFKTDPSGPTPYTSFLAEFDVPEIKSAMKLLYTLNEVDKSELQSQINVIIEQNGKLLARSEVIKNEDTLALMNMLKQIPMFLAAIKMVFDMITLIGMFVSQMSLF